MYRKTFSIFMDTTWGVAKLLIIAIRSARCRYYRAAVQNYRRSCVASNKITITNQLPYPCWFAPTLHLYIHQLKHAPGISPGSTFDATFCLQLNCLWLLTRCNFFLNNEKKNFYWLANRRRWNMKLFLISGNR